MNGEQKERATGVSAPQTMEERMALIRSWKGAAGSILWALMKEGGSLTAVELERATGYSDKPIREAFPKLKAVGFVEHHGRSQGWALSKIARVEMLLWLVAPKMAIAAWNESIGSAGTAQGADEGPMRSLSEHKLSTDLEEEGGDASATAETGADSAHDAGSPTRKNSGNGSENFRIRDSDQICSDIDLIQDINKQESDLIKPDLMQTFGKSDDSRSGNGGLVTERETRNGRGRGEEKALETFLKLIKIEDPAFSEILARDRLVDVVAWHWFTLGKAWIKKPRGWVITCLTKGDAPKPAYLEFARVWLAMSAEDYNDYLAVKHHPYVVEDYWREWDLNQEVLEVFNRAVRLGGLELFDDFTRPILSNQG